MAVQHSTGLVLILKDNNAIKLLFSLNIEAAHRFSAFLTAFCLAVSFGCAFCALLAFALVRRCRFEAGSSGSTSASSSLSANDVTISDFPH